MIGVVLLGFHAKKGGQFTENFGIRTEQNLVVAELHLLGPV